MTRAGYDEKGLSEALCRCNHKTATETVRVWLLGKRTPNLSTIKVIASVLDTNLSSLVENIP